MLDENLPTFFIAESPDGVKHHSTFYLTRGGSDPEPAYSLHRADPSTDTSRNCYAAALFDAWNPGILYGEVLVQPRWTSPTASGDQQSRGTTAGIPPPPEPLMPTEFTIQLYNPDQQVTVTQKVSSLVGTSRWEFGIPQDTFRMPSGSILDRSQDDPAASTTTPKINFAWRKEGKFGGKDLTCVVTGKSTDVQVGKKKGKDPDIAVAIAKGLKEVTIYESNLYRVDLEDPKGLEVCLLLGAAVIRDVYFSSTSIKQLFNISDGPRRASKDTPASASAVVPVDGVNGLSAKPNLPPRSHRSHSQPPQPTAGNQPITDPRTQWEIDAETQRLKAQTEADRRLAEQRRREQERADEEEAKRLRKAFEAEEKERRAQKKKVDRETERLRKLYGPQQLQQPSRPPAQQPQQQQAPHYPYAPLPHRPAPQQQPAPLPPPQPQRPQPPPQSHSVPIMQSPFQSSANPAQPYSSHLNFYGRHPVRPSHGGSSSHHQSHHQSHGASRSISNEEPVVASATSGPFLQPAFDMLAEGSSALSKRKSFGV